MRNTFVIIIACLLVGACTSKNTKPPKDIISEEQMINLLVDIRLLEGAYSQNYRGIDTSDFKVSMYYQKLFQEKGISSERFTSSYAFYSKQNGKMPEIENAVMEKLSEIQAQLESEK